MIYQCAKVQPERGMDVQSTDAPCEGFHAQWGASLVGPTAKAGHHCQSAPRYTTPNVCPWPCNSVLSSCRSLAFGAAGLNLCPPSLGGPGPRTTVSSPLPPMAPVVQLSLYSWLASEFLGVWQWERYWTSPCLISLAECPLLWPCGCHLETAFLGFGERAGFLTNYPISFLVFPGYLSSPFYLIPFLDLLEFHDLILSSPFPVLPRAVCSPFGLHFGSYLIALLSHLTSIVHVLSKEASPCLISPFP